MTAVRATWLGLCLMAACVPAALPNTDAADVPDDSVVLPVIPDEDRRLILQGVWWDLNPGVLPELSAMQAIETVEGDGVATTDREAVVDPFPEDSETINEQFLPEYIKQAPMSLIDPQRLLEEIEREDAVKLIASLEQKYKVRIYVSIFSPGQEVPPSVNAPALARQIFGQNERSLLLHVHYGEVMSMQIACDTGLMSLIGDQGRRALLAKVKESASIYTDAQDSLLEAIASMILFAQPGMQEVLKTEPEQVATAAAKVPPVNLEFEEKEVQKKSSLVEHLKSLGTEFRHYTPHLVVSILILVALVAGFLWWRNWRPVRLLPSESDKRLGAPCGAGVSRVVSYGDKDDANPDSISRRQMRDHLRDIS